MNIKLNVDKNESSMRDVDDTYYINLRGQTATSSKDIVAPVLASNILGKS